MDFSIAARKELELPASFCMHCSILTALCARACRGARIKTVRTGARGDVMMVTAVPWNRSFAKKVLPFDFARQLFLMSGASACFISITSLRLLTRSLIAASDFATICGVGFVPAVSLDLIAAYWDEPERDAIFSLKKLKLPMISMQPAEPNPTSSRVSGPPWM